MKHPHSSCSVLLILLSSVVLTTGCGTLIGAGIGSLADGPEYIEKRRPVSFLYDIGSDERITVTLDSGKTYTGIFHGFQNPTTETLDSILYSITEAPPVSPHAAPLQCGDTVAVTLIDGSSYAAMFSGCHISHVYVYHLGERRHVSVALPLVDELQRRDGLRLDESSLRESVHRGCIPPLTSVLLEADGKIEALPMRDIQSIMTLSQSHSGVILGSLLGAAWDILIFSTVAGWQGHGF